MDFDAFAREVEVAYHLARRKHGRMASWHEGYAVMLEEVDELWDEIKRDATYDRKSEEIVQIAAMCFAMLNELD